LRTAVAAACFSWAAVCDWTDVTRFVKVLEPFWLELLCNRYRAFQDWDGPNAWDVVTIFHQSETELRPGVVQASLVDPRRRETQLIIQRAGPLPISLTGNQLPMPLPEDSAPPSLGEAGRIA
jgi:hypothetical protein